MTLHTLTNYFGVAFVVGFALLCIAASVQLSYIERRDRRGYKLVSRPHLPGDQCDVDPRTGFCRIEPHAGSPHWFWLLTSWPIFIVLRLLRSECMNLTRHGRHNCWCPVLCACGWRGLAKELAHDYEANGPDDVIPIDLCPNCEGDALTFFHAFTLALGPVPARIPSSTPRH